MSKVICPNCCEIDSFVLTPCTKCGYLPETAISTIFKWNFTDHNYNIEGLKLLSNYYRQFDVIPNIDNRIIAFQNFTFFHNPLLFPPLIPLDNNSFLLFRDNEKFKFPKDFFKVFTTSPAGIACVLNYHFSERNNLNFHKSNFNYNKYKSFFNTIRKQENLREAIFSAFYLRLVVHVLCQRNEYFEQDLNMKYIHINPLVSSIVKLIDLLATNLPKNILSQFLILSEYLLNFYYFEPNEVLIHKIINDLRINWKSLGLSNFDYEGLFNPLNRMLDLFTYEGDFFAKLPKVHIFDSSIIIQKALYKKREQLNRSVFNSISNEYFVKTGVVIDF